MERVISTSALGSSAATTQPNQAAIKQQLAAYSQSVADQQKSGKLTGSALKQAQQQVSDLNNAFNNQTKNGGSVSQANLQYFSKQISGGNAVLAQSADDKKTDDKKTDDKKTGKTTTSSGTSTTKPDTTSTSPQIQAQLKALSTLTQLNANNAANAYSKTANLFA